jgi:hypothetical protein
MLNRACTDPVETLAISSLTAASSLAVRSCRLRAGRTTGKVSLIFLPAFGKLLLTESLLNHAKRANRDTSVGVGIGAQREGGGGGVRNMGVV